MATTSEPRVPRIPDIAPNRSRLVAAGAVAAFIGILGVTGHLGKGGGKSGQAYDPNRPGDVPASTLNYLENLQPREYTVQPGDGVDTVALAVDQGRYNMSQHIHDGIRRIITNQTPNHDGTLVEGQDVTVPFIPPGTQPPAAAK